MAEQQQIQENKPIPKGQIEAYKELFAMFDIDGNGTITCEEFRYALQEIGQNPTQRETAEMLEKISANKDENGIQFEEFCNIMNENSTTSDDEMRAAFQLFDKDGNGTLDKDELRRALTLIGEEKMSEEELDEIFKEADVDGNGKIEYEEFVKMMCQ